MIRLWPPTEADVFAQIRWRRRTMKIVNWHSFAMEIQSKTKLRTTLNYILSSFQSIYRLIWSESLSAIYLSNTRRTDGITYWPCQCRYMSSMNRRPHRVQSKNRKISTHLVRYASVLVVGWWGPEEEVEHHRWLQLLSNERVRPVCGTRQSLPWFIQCPGSQWRVNASIDSALCSHEWPAAGNDTPPHYYAPCRELGAASKTTECQCCRKRCVCVCVSCCELR